MEEVEAEGELAPLLVGAMSWTGDASSSRDQRGSQQERVRERQREINFRRWSGDGVFASDTSQSSN